MNSKRSFAKPRSETGVSDRTRLLLSIDPLAALAESQSQLHDRLLEMTPHPYPDLQAAWHDAATAGFATEAPPGRVECSKEQVLILVTFRDEKLQVELLGRFATEALTCKALLS